MEEARGVVWDHGTVENAGQQLHKYVVVLVLVTDTPIPQAAQGSDTGHVGRDTSRLPPVCRAPVYATLSEALTGTLCAVKTPYRLGDATDVLHSVGDWDPAEMLRSSRMGEEVR